MKSAPNKYTLILLIGFGLFLAFVKSEDYTRRNDYRRRDVEDEREERASFGNARLQDVDWLRGDTSSYVSESTRNYAILVFVAFALLLANCQRLERRIRDLEADKEACDEAVP